MALIVPAATAGTTVKTPSLRLQRTAKACSVAKKIQKAGAPSVWRPTQITDYMFDETDWMYLGTSQRAYDKQGNVLSEESTDMDDYKTKTVYTYDSNNQVQTQLTTVSDDGETWVNDQKRSYTYDPVVVDYYTERLSYTWQNTEWATDYYCEKNIITRNAAGNITEIVKQLPLGGGLADAYRSVWQYDAASGKANKFSYYTNDGEGSWALYDDVEYGDIEWAATDGQMTKSEILDYIEGANLLKRAVFYSDGQALDIVEVTYTDKPGEYTMKMLYKLEDKTVVVASKEKKFTDANGSYTITVKEFVDYDTNLVYDEPQYVEVQTVAVNDKGDVTLETITAGEGEEAEFMGQKYDYTYDDNGNMTEMISSVYNADTESYIPEMRSVYANYKDVANDPSAVTDIVAGSDSAPVYYNLQGRRVANPDKGLYIRVLNGKADKVIL